MNSLNTAIQNAMESEGQLKDANKAYLEFIKANFIIPIEKDSAEDEPRVLFFNEGANVFLPVFSDISHLQNWAQDISQEIQVLKLSGVDLLKGLGDNVFVSLDIGTATYKEFNPSETGRMKSMVLKLFKN